MPTTKIDKNSMNTHLLRPHQVALNDPSLSFLDKLIVADLEIDFYNFVGEGRISDVEWNCVSHKNWASNADSILRSISEKQVVTSKHFLDIFLLNPSPDVHTYFPILGLSINVMKKIKLASFGIALLKNQNDRYFLDTLISEFLCKELASPRS